MEAMALAIAGDNPSMRALELMLKYGTKLKPTGSAIAAAEVGNLET
jgi:hypothetical protein